MSSIFYKFPLFQQSWKQLFLTRENKNINISTFTDQENV